MVSADTLKTEKCFLQMSTAANYRLNRGNGRVTTKTIDQRP